MRLQLFDAEPRGRCAGATAAHAGFGRKGRLKVLPQLASLCTCRKNYARFRQFFSVPVSPDVPTAGGQHDANGGEGIARKHFLCKLRPPSSGLLPKKTKEGRG